jgi:hypothetical protein
MEMLQLKIKSFESAAAGRRAIVADSVQPSSISRLLVLLNGGENILHYRLIRRDYLLLQMYDPQAPSEAEGHPDYQHTDIYGYCSTKFHTFNTSPVSSNRD